MVRASKEKGVIKGAYYKRKGGNFYLKVGFLFDKKGIFFYDARAPFIIKIFFL